LHFKEITMADDSTMSDKLARMKALVDEISSHIEQSIGETPGLTARRRFDCGDYTCHGHFTCSSFGCGAGFKLAD